MHVEVHGRTDPGAPVVFLSSGLGGSGAFWAPQIGPLGHDFRVVTYDHRGTGRSGGALPTPYGVADMAAEAAAILDDMDIRRCHFVGHALGGLIGLQLALDRPALLGSLTVVNGWARADSQTARCFAVRTSLLRGSGAAAYVQAQPIFLYPAAWLSAHAGRVAKEEAAALDHFPGDEIVLARIGAVLAFDIADRLADIATPTLLVASRDDILVPYTCSERLALGLPDARLNIIETGGHACTVTQEQAFNAALIGFLQAMG